MISENPAYAAGFFVCMRPRRPPRLSRTLHGLQAAPDDYSEIMLKALAGRLAEAFAESLHERVCTELGLR